MKPAMRAGNPAISQVNVPIIFPDFDIPTGSHLRGQSMVSGIPTRVISGVRWSQAPAFSDVLAVYPEKAKAAKVGGRATLDCVMGKDGTISRCDALQEQPASNGFGSAARKLASKFVGPTVDGSGRSLAGVHVQVPFVFAVESLASASPLIGKPDWIQLPQLKDMTNAFPTEARKAGLKKARVVLSCTVGTGGGLAACAVESEDPAGYGIGKATAGLAGTFKLSVWAQEGLPTVGGTVRVPIRYDFTDGSGPAAN
jgi:TonB family protein